MSTVLDEMDETLHRIKAAGEQLKNWNPTKEEIRVHRGYGGERTFTLTIKDDGQFEAVRRVLAPWYVFRSPRR